MKKTKLISALLLGALIAAIPLKSSAVVTNLNTQTITSNGTGVQTNFTIGFDFRDNSQVTVKEVETSVSPAVTTSISQGAGAGKFTISGGNPGTTVVMGTAPTTTQFLIIGRSIPLTQPVAFSYSAPFPYTDFGTQFDLMTLQLQNLNALLGGGSGGGGGGGGGGNSTSTFPAALANNLIGFNASASSTSTFPGPGQTLVNQDVLEFNGSTWIPYLLNSSNIVGLVNGGGGTVQPGAGGTGVANSTTLTWNKNLTFSAPADGTYTLPAAGTLIAGTTNTGNVASTIVIRDGSGNFSSNQITANSFVGPVTGAVTGNVTGNVTGTSANITGTVAIGHGGTGQTTQAAAITALAGTQTSNTFLRSDGVNTSLQSIIAADLPTVPRSKIAQATANTAVINDGSGNLSVLPAGTLGNIMTSDGTKWISAAPSNINSGVITYAGTDSGTVNNFVVTPTSPLVAYGVGIGISFVAANTNTGACTINVSGLGAVPLKSVRATALVSNAIISGQMVSAIYDGVEFLMISQETAADSANVANELVKRDGSGNFSAGTITATLSGSATSATSATNATNSSNVSTTSVGNNATYYPIFVSSSANGNQAVDLNSGLSFNPSTSTLSTTTFSGNLSGTATNFSGSLSGDVTGTQSATTIASSAVTNAKLANMPGHTYKGNNTGSSAAPLDLTATQLTAELNAMVGDSGSGGTKGLVPAPAAGDAAAGKLLKADGTWTAAGAGTVTSVAAPVVPVGYTSSVTNGTTTPAITISSNGQPKDLYNVGISATISSSTLVVALKQSDGSTDCTSGSPCVAQFRNSTASTGGYSSHSFTAAASITLGTADSIGTVAAVAFDLYVYLVVDSTSEICLSRSWFDETKLQSASALTAGADTTATTMWCPGAHTSRPIRLIGKLSGAVWSNPNWAAPTTVQILPPDNGCAHVSGTVDRCTEDFVGTCAASSSITQNATSWVSTLGNIGGASAPTGGCLITSASGVWSGVPTCTISGNTNITGALSVTINPTTTTAMTTDCFTSADCSSYSFNLNCKGPR